MNNSIQKLYQIANKRERIIIGLMSGTSVDGLDIALCKIKNNGLKTSLELLQFATAKYTSSYREKVASIFSKKMVHLEAVCLINEWIGVQHSKLILQQLKKWNIKPSEVDLIASHGQTIYHAPKWMHQLKEFGNGTLQIGDGDHIAVHTGIITISDFRQKHIAAGGEGAPLAVYGDYFIFGKKGEDRIMLNIGGIANYTYLPSSMDIHKVFSTDVGPGNTLMDAYCKKYFQKNYDKDGQFAQKGNVNEKLLQQLLSHPFLKAAFPKTTGPELFNLHYLKESLTASGTQKLNKHDVLRTLNEFSAQVIVQAILKVFPKNKKIHIYSSGGGIHNTLLMHTIQSLLPNATFSTTSNLHIHPDAKEAVLFAILANETIAGHSQKEKTKIKNIPFIKMGKISLPD